MTEQDNEIPRRLLAAASEQFARHGYSLTRVRDIVREAEVNLASVNYYFGGKEGLYAATLRELADRRRAETAVPDPQATQGSAENALYQEVLAILRRFVDGERSSAPLGRILAHESMNPTHYFDKLITEIVRPEVEKLTGIVRRLAGEGADEAGVMRAAMSVMGQCLFYLFARGAIERAWPQMAPGAGNCEALARHITGFSLMGIAVHASKGGSSRAA
jgi:AcrR family transcriptional regulator